jgi:hypothetical protein
MIRQAHRLQIEGDVGHRHPRGRNYQDTDEDGQAQENAAGFGGWLGCVTIDGLCDVQCNMPLNGSASSAMKTHPITRAR